MTDTETASAGQNVPHQQDNCTQKPLRNRAGHGTGGAGALHS